MYEKKKKKKKKEDILLNYRYKYLFQHCSNFLPLQKVVVCYSVKTFVIWALELSLMF